MRTLENKYRRKKQENNKSTRYFLYLILVSSYKKNLPHRFIVKIKKNNSYKLSKT